MILWLIIFSLSSYTMLFFGLYSLIIGQPETGLPLLIFGVPFSAAITIVNVIMLKKRKKDKDLQKKKHITARLTGFETDESVTYNGQYAVRIKCEYNDNGVVKRYISDSIFTDIDSFLVGAPINVYYDENDPNDYYVDTSEFGKSPTIPLGTPTIVGGLFCLVGSVFFLFGLFFLSGGSYIGLFFSIFGGFFILLGGGILLYFVLEGKREKALRCMSDTGENAVISRLKYRKGRFFNGVDPCKAIFTYTTDGKQKTFASKEFYHPEPEKLIGMTFKLNRSKSNPRVVDVDLSDVVQPGQMRISSDGPFLSGPIINAFAISGGAVVLIGLILEIVLSGTFKGFAILFSSVICLSGLFFGAIGFIPIIINSVKRNKQRKLRSTGKRVQAVVTDVAENQNVTVNGVNPSRITCESTDPASDPRVFTGENTYRSFDREHLIGKPVTVFVSQDEPNQYLVDVIGLLSQYDDIIRREL